jgi:hypothetical protein
LLLGSGFCLAGIARDLLAVVAFLFTGHCEKFREVGEMCVLLG